MNDEKKNKLQHDIHYLFGSAVSKLPLGLLELDLDENWAADADCPQELFGFCKLIVAMASPNKLKEEPTFADAIGYLAIDASDRELRVLLGSLSD